MAFVEITPREQPRIVVGEFALDVINSFEHLKQAQAPHVVALFNPLALMQHHSGHVYEEFYIKLPGSPVFVPEWLAGTGMAQAMAGHRKASSAFYEQDGWGMLFERNHVEKNRFPRVNLQGIHTDDRAIDIALGTQRSVVTYHVEAGIPARFYNSIKADTPKSEFERMARTEQHFLDAFEYDEADEICHSFYSKHLTDKKHASVPSGTMTCFGGMVIHGSGIATRSDWRAMLHFRTFPMYTGRYPDKLEKSIAQNPPLFEWYKKHLAPAA